MKKYNVLNTSLLLVAIGIFIAGGIWVNDYRPNFNINTSSGIADVVSCENAGVVTVTAANTTICTLAALTVNDTDIVLVHGQALCSKGATAGDYDLIVNQSAGANIQFLNASTWSTQVSQYVPVSAAEWNLAFGIGYFPFGSSPGTVTLRLQATSSGSNCSVSAQNGQLSAIVIHQ